jgi:hypothetical protein
MRFNFRRIPPAFLFFLAYFVLCRFFVHNSWNPYFLSNWALFDTVVPEKFTYDLVIERQGKPMFFAREMTRDWRDRGIRTNPAWNILLWELPGHARDNGEAAPPSQKTLDRLREEVLPHCGCSSFQVVRIPVSLQDHILWKKNSGYSVIAEVK